MAIVQGIKEKVHLPIYDSLSVGGAQQLRDVETTSILKFFVNVQGKTKVGNKSPIGVTVAALQHV